MYRYFRGSAEIKPQIQGKEKACKRVGDAGKE